MASRNVDKDLISFDDDDDTDRTTETLESTIDPDASNAGQGRNGSNEHVASGEIGDNGFESGDSLKFESDDSNRYGSKPVIAKPVGTPTWNGPRNWGTRWGPDSFMDWHKECPLCALDPSRRTCHSSHSPLNRNFAAVDCCSPSSPIGNLFKTDLDMMDAEAAFLQEVPEFAALAQCFHKDGVGYVDTHCHLDLLFQREAHPGSYEAYRERRKSTWAKCYEGKGADDSYSLGEAMMRYCI